LDFDYILYNVDKSVSASWLVGELLGLFMPKTIQSLDYLLFIYVVIIRQYQPSLQSEFCCFM